MRMSLLGNVEMLICVSMFFMLKFINQSLDIHYGLKLRVVVMSVLRLLLGVVADLRHSQRFFSVDTTNIKREFLASDYTEKVFVDIHKYNDIRCLVLN